MDENEFGELLRIQRMMASRIIEETTVNNKIKLLDLVNKLLTDRNKKIQKETIIIEAQLDGFSEVDTLRIIDELVSDKLLYEPEPGYIKRT